MMNDMNNGESKNTGNFLKGALAGALVMLLLAILAGGAIFLHANIKNKADAKNLITERTEAKAEFLKELVDTMYLYADDVKKEDLETGIYKGIIEALGDPHSAYYDEQETKNLFEEAEGVFYGIGATFSQNRETKIITVVNIHKGSPAEKAGLKEEDVLYKVEGEDISGEDISDVVRKIKGEEGTEVTITVLRGENVEEVELTMKRAKIEVDTVEYEMKEDGIGYIHISAFDSVTVQQYKNAMTDLENQGMKGLVVDLRGNLGGSVDAVCKILDSLLPEGTIVYTEDRMKKRETYTSDEENQFRKPLVVLVNGYSASSSEIFAGAIQDYGIGTIVGTQTYGKGIVQQTFPLNDGSSVKITISEYFTPKGRNIHEIGITPDVEVEYKPHEQNEEADNQLDEALKIVKEKL